MKKVAVLFAVMSVLSACNQQTVAPQFELVPGATRKISQLVGEFDFETGQPTLSRTVTQCNLLGTDGGNSFEHDGKLWFFFGDSDHPFDVPPEMDCLNAMAWATVEDPQRLTLQFLTDANRILGKTVWRSPVLLDRHGRLHNLQAFNTPLDGFSDGKDLYVLWSVDFMRRSVLSRTSDLAGTFHEVYELGNSHFINVDAVERSDLALPGLKQFGRTDWIFFFGSGTVRNKHVYLAVTPREGMRKGDRSAVHFLRSADVSKQDPVIQWSKNEHDAAPLFLIEGNGWDFTIGPFHSPWGGTEPNVHYNDELGLYFAVYSDLVTVRLRTARFPWGPWTKPITIFDPFKDYGNGPAMGTFLHSPHLSDGETLKAGDCTNGSHHPLCDKAHNDGQEMEGGGVYGAWVIEKFTEVAADGRVTLYFLLSTQSPYTVVLMKTTLQRIKGP